MSFNATVTITGSTNITNFDIYQCPTSGCTGCVAITGSTGQDVSRMKLLTGHTVNVDQGYRYIKLVANTETCDNSICMEVVGIPIPTGTPTSTPTPTTTVGPTNTPTPTSTTTVGPTNTPTPTSTITGTPTITNTPTPTPTPTTTITQGQIFYRADEVLLSSYATSYCSQAGYLISGPVYSDVSFSNLLPNTSVIYTNSDLTQPLAGNGINYRIAISDVSTTNTSGGQFTWVSLDANGLIINKGTYTCGGEENIQ